MRSLLQKIRDDLQGIPLSDFIFLGFLVLLGLASAAGLALTLFGTPGFFHLFLWVLPLALSVFGLWLVLSAKDTEGFKAGMLAALLVLVIWPSWLAGGSSAVTLLFMLLVLAESFLLLETPVFSWCIAGLSGGSAIALLIINFLMPDLIPPDRTTRFVDDLVQLLFVFGGTAVSLSLFIRSYRQQESVLDALDEQLERADCIDVLTGTLNRKSILRALEETADKEDLFLLKLDVDRFRRLNDYYGITAGDKVLAHVAAHAKSIVGAGGLIGRFGGDEFLILLVHVSDMQVKNISERLLWVPPCEGTVLSVSGGAVKGPQGQEVRQLLRRAERLVQEAKRQGRSRMALWDGQILRTE